LYPIQQIKLIELLTVWLKRFGNYATWHGIRVHVILFNKVRRSGMDV